MTYDYMSQTLIGLAIAILLIIIKLQSDKISDREKQLFAKRHSVYNEVFSIFFDIIKNTVNPKHDISDLGSRMLDAKKDLIILAPDHILNAFLLLSNKASEKGKKYEVFLEYIELLIFIRKDLGIKTSLTPDKLLRSLMVSDVDFEKFKNEFDAIRKKRKTKIPKN